ncbi:MAG: DUF1214 domain-containing protein [Rhizobiaceae bacterium]
MIGLGLGGVLSLYSIQNIHGFGALQIGQWTAWPQAGSQNADPYTKAKVAAAGEVPLGASEGIVFHAKTDKTGKRLLLECNYHVSGRTPPARLWTISIHNDDGTTVGKNLSLYSKLLSQTLVRQQDGRFTITVSPEASPGNWLRTRGNGVYQLILRLYDSPLTSTRGIVDPEMPEISLLGCPS